MKCEVKVCLDLITELSYHENTMREWTGDNIRDLRELMELSRANFSTLLGVTRTYVMLLEKGVKTPSKTLQLLLNYVEKDLVEQKQKEATYGKDQSRSLTQSAGKTKA